ncbi:MAG: hypothetical protein GDA38_13795 [Hormoscilla sp. SP12CHS1]|nr:hypothetical protein [Hormoscilla sp. SP12CHS1]
MLSSNIYLLPCPGCSLLNKGRSHVGAIARGLRNRVSYTNVALRRSFIAETRFLADSRPLRVGDQGAIALG